MALLHQNYAGFDGRAVQLDSGDLRVGLRELDLGDLTVRQMTSTRTLSWETALPEGWVGLWLPGRHRVPCSWQGAEVADSLCVVQGGRDQLIRVPSGWADIDLAVRVETLIEAGVFSEATLTADSRRAQPIVRLSQRVSGSLRQRMRSLLSALDTVAAVCSSPARAQALRQAILDELLQVVRPAASAQGPSRVRESDYVSLVRKALAEVTDPAAPVRSTSALARRAGRSERALQRAFGSVLGVSPYQYLLRKRLADARTTLLSGACISVTRLAADYEFASVSEFARYYKRQFGELPTTTVKRRSG